MPLVELKNIHFSYKISDTGFNGATDVEKYQSVFHLSGININIEKGEFISILGPNGSGKSTLLKILTGTLHPDSGSIKIKDKEYRQFSKKSLAKNIAFVPQSTVSVFPFSVYEIIMMGRTPYMSFMGYENDKDREIVNEALELVEISHLKNHGINEVSGGEAQRAFIARALVQEPELLLLDEPNSHLDIKHQLSIFNLIKKLNLESKLTVISVSHDLNLAGFYSERMILMMQGKIFRDDTVDEILTSKNIKEVFGVDSSINKISETNKINIVYKPYTQ